MYRTNNEPTPPRPLLAYLNENLDRSEQAVRRRSVLTRADHGAWTLVMSIVHAFPTPMHRPKIARSHDYERVKLVEDWLDLELSRAFVDDVQHGQITIGNTVAKRERSAYWQSELVSSHNAFMRGTGLVVRTRFEERPLDLSQAPLISRDCPYYSDTESAARDWLELPEYHGASDARNTEVIFLLPEGRAFFVSVSHKNGNLRLALAGSEIGRSKFLIKGAYWIGSGIHQLETEVHGNQASLAVPEKIDRLEYSLLDQNGQVRDFRHETQSTIPPGFVAGPEDSGGFRELFPSAEFSSAPPDDAPGNAPSQRASGTAMKDLWAAESAQIVDQLEKIESALNSVSAALNQISEARVDTMPAPGIGHNLPPSGESLASTIDQAIVAKNLIKEEAAKTRPSSNALSLSAHVFDSAANLASWLLSQGKTFVEEAVRSAGKKFGERTIDLTAFFGSVEILRAQLPNIANAIRAVLRLIGLSS